MCSLYFLCAEFILLEETSSNNYFILKKHLQWNCYLFQETEIIICLCASNLLLFICKWKFCYCLFASVQSQIQVWVRFAILTSHEWILSRMNCFVRIWKIQLKPQNFSEKSQTYWHLLYHEWLVEDMNLRQSKAGIFCYWHQASK